jgi:death on curing protein
MRYLVIEDILVIHDDIIDATTGSIGIRDKNLLESAVNRMRASFGGKDLYPDIFSKAATLMHSIVKNHPFVDGNKRTALASASIFLSINGYVIELPHQETEDFMVKVASSKMDIEEIALFLKKHTT